jgi:hypothetical protein
MTQPKAIAGLLGRIVLNAWREQIFKYLIRDHNTLAGLQLRETLLEVALVH